MLQSERVFQLRQPLEQDLTFLNTWLERPKSGDNFLRALEKSIYSPKNASDFVALGVRAGESDVFTMWLINKFMAWFHCCIGQYLCVSKPGDEEAGFVEYSDSKVLAVSNVIVTLLSSMIPVTSTIGLYFVPGIKLRLGLVAVFMVIFCTVLAICTNARRVEIFGATAACVLPHFINPSSSSTHFIDEINTVEHQKRYDENC